jgi:hypothetical protein
MHSLKDVSGSRAGIRTPVTGAKAPHPWPLDDPALPPIEYMHEHHIIFMCDLEVFKAFGWDIDNNINFNVSRGLMLISRVTINNNIIGLMPS